jgi:hypothetical protein
VVLLGVQQAAEAVAAADRAGEVGDVLGNGMLAADGTGVNAIALSGLAHRIIAAVEVLALLEMLGEVVAFAGELPVEPEEALLLGGERLRGNRSANDLFSRVTIAAMLGRDSKDVADRLVA